MCSLQEEVCLCDNHEETHGHPHRGEALQLRPLRQAVHTEGESEGKSESSLCEEDVDCIFQRFMRGHIGITGHSSATFADKNFTERNQCKNTNIASTEPYIGSSDPADNMGRR